MKGGVKLTRFKAEKKIPGQGTTIIDEVEESDLDAHHHKSNIDCNDPKPSKGHMNW